MKLPFVSVVVLNYNGKEHTVELLESLKKVNYPKYETIVVDNGSSDGSVKAIRKYFPYVRVVETGKNLGYDGGMNVGIKSSKSEYVVIINNDLTVDSQWLIELVKTATSNEIIGIVGSMILYYDRENIIDKIGPVETNKIAVGFKYLGRGEKDEGQYSDVIDVAFTDGLIKKEVFEKIGLFDEKFFVYFDEVDLCYRARKAGYRIVVNPKSKMWNKGSQTIGKDNYFAIFNTYKNKIRFILKNYDNPTKTLALGFNLVYYFVKFILYMSINRIDLSKAMIDAIIWNFNNAKDYLE